MNEYEQAFCFTTGRPSNKLWLMFLCTLLGIFLGLTLTVVASLLVFWRKSNAVFALQKCEQRDFDDDDV